MSLTSYQTAPPRDLIKTCYITIEILSKCIVKNTLLITGGAGFVGANLIELFLKKTKLNIISYDNYSTGSIHNHIKSGRVKYIKGNTKEIKKNISNTIISIKWRVYDESDLLHYFTDSNGILSDKEVYEHKKLLLNNIKTITGAKNSDKFIIILSKPLTKPVCLI